MGFQTILKYSEKATDVVIIVINLYINIVLRLWKCIKENDMGHYASDP